MNRSPAPFVSTAVTDGAAGAAGRARRRRRRPRRQRDDHRRAVPGQRFGGLLGVVDAGQERCLGVVRHERPGRGQRRRQPTGQGTRVEVTHHRVDGAAGRRLGYLGQVDHDRPRLQRGNRLAVARQIGRDGDEGAVAVQGQDRRDGRRIGARADPADALLGQETGEDAATQVVSHRRHHDRLQIQPGETERHVGKPARCELDTLGHALLAQSRHRTHAAEGDVQERRSRADHVDAHANRPASAGCSVR